MMCVLQSVSTCLKVMVIMRTVLQTAAQDGLQFEDTLGTTVSPLAALLTELSASTLHKCLCTANEYWKDGGCHHANTTVEVVSFAPYTQTVVPAISYGGNDVAELKCKENQIDIVLEDFALIVSGALFDKGSGVSHTTDEYCIEHVATFGNEVKTEAHVCVNEPKLPSCCPRGLTFNFRELKCKTGGNETAVFSPEVKSGNKSFTVSQEALLLQPFAECKKGNEPRHYRLTSGTNSSLEYRDTGVYLHVEKSDKKDIFYTPSNYCIAVEHLNGTYYAVVCAPRKSTCEQAMVEVLFVFLFISCIFLSLTMLLFLMFPEQKVRAGSRSLFCHALSLLAAFLCLIIQHLKDDVNCKVMGPVVQFSFLATFFWLNVMCFDIWRLLRMKNPGVESLQMTRRRFNLYSVYAWGCPILLSLVTIIMDNLPVSAANEKLILPGFGPGHCWFSSHIASFVYLFGAVSTLMAVNCILCVWVVVILVHAQCASSSVLETSATKVKERAWMYLKLFVMMGLTWICEVFAWYDGSCEYWIATDIINSLRGFLIFVIFFGNKKSFTKLQEKLLRVLHTLRVQFVGPEPVEEPNPLEETASASPPSVRTLQTSMESLHRQQDALSETSREEEDKLDKVTVLENGDIVKTKTPVVRFYLGDEE